MTKLNENIKIDPVEELISYVFELDETSVVLKAHLFLEQTIDQLITLLAVSPELILKESFRKKVNFLYSIGVVKNRFQERLLMINTIRNKFSHEYKYKLSLIDIESLKKMTLSGKPINIPDKLLTFPRAKESFLFVSAVSLQSQILEMLIKLDKDIVNRNIFIEAVDALHKK